MNFTKSLTPAKILLCGAFVLAGLLSQSSISLAQDDPWKTKTPMPTARGAAIAAAGGKIYAFGGSNEKPPFNGYVNVEEYDPASDSWTIKKNMQTGREGSSAVTIDGKIFLIGGMEKNSYPYPLYSSVEMYDPATDTWITKSPMPTGRVFLSASVVNGKIYAIGGENEIHGGFLSVVEEYVPVLDTWAIKTPMPTARFGLSTSVVSGKIYAIGGNVERTSATGLSVVEEYDPVTDTWTPKTDMPTKRSRLSTCTMGDMIFAFGGLGSLGMIKVVEVYNPAADTWTTKSDMPTQRFGLGTSVVGEKIYAIGGIPCIFCDPIAVNEEFTPELASSIENNYVQVPETFVLHQNFPNPFNHVTTIEYAVQQSSHMKLKIYNTIGQTVRTLVDDYKTTGQYSVVWDGKDNSGKVTPSGIYFYEIKTDGGASTKKMILME